MSSKPEELSPEERLLKVIQQGKGASAAAAAATPVAAAAVPVTPVPVAAKVAEKAETPSPSQPPAEKPAPKTSVPIVELAKPKLKLAGAEKTDRTDKTETATPAPIAPAPALGRSAFLGLRGVNRILLAAVVVGILAVAYDLWADRPAERMSFKSDFALTDKFPQPVSLPPMDTLMQKVGDRNLFNLPAKPVDNKTDKTDRAPKVEKPAANFKLMGVSPDDKHPEESMAIIHDQTSGNTYFLKSGQRLADTEYTLGAIRAESVILKTLKGEMELR
jgi:hypothetical protein